MDHLAEQSDIHTEQEARAYMATVGVVAEPGVPLLRATQVLAACLKGNPATVPSTLAAEDKARYLQVIWRRHDAFAVCLADLHVPADVEPFSIHTFGPPSHTAALRLSDAHLGFVRKEVAEAEAAGLLVTSRGPWASPAFAVPKPRSEKLRLVIDYRKLNLQTVRDSYPLPLIEQVVRQVGRWAVFFKLDLKSGFW